MPHNENRDLQVQESRMGDAKAAGAKLWSERERVHPAHDAALSGPARRVRQKRHDKGDDH